MDGNLYVGQFVFSNVKLQKIKFGIRAREGDINLDPIVADLYQGKYQGKVNLNAKGKVPALNANTILQGVQMEPLYKDFSLEKTSPVTGTANISGKLSAAGNNTDQMQQALDGKLDLKVNNGVVIGIDVYKTLKAADEAIQKGIIPSSNPVAGETRFNNMTATLNINNGVVRTDNLLLASSNFAIKGGIDRSNIVANLNDGTMKFDAVIITDAMPTLAGNDIPLKCRGEFANIKSACKPDTEEIAKRQIGKFVIDKLGEQLGIPVVPGTESGQTAPKESTTKDPGSQIKKDIESIKDLFDKF